MKTPQNRKCVSRILGLASSYSLFLWLLIMIMHIAGMLKYWWPPYRAHGFVVTHPRFWSQEVLPWLLVAFCLTSSVLLLWRRTAAFVGLMYSFPAAYLGAALAARLLFPLSSTTDLHNSRGWPYVFQWGFWMTLLLWALLLMGLIVLSSYGRRRRWALIMPISLFNLLLGAFVIWSQRADTPATRPFSDRMITPTILGKPIDADGPLPAWGIRLEPKAERFEIDVKHLTIYVAPILKFHVRSPDRCGVIFLPSYPQSNSVRQYDITTYTAKGAYMMYSGKEPAWLHVAARRDADAPLYLEAQTSLPEPVYTHKNTFCGVSIKGYKRLSLLFSPIPDSPIQLNMNPHPDYYDDSAGFCYLDKRGFFHWVKGTWEEKGPFTELASGFLGQDAPITVTIMDDGIPQCRITLQDWASQLSLAMSPTAGWGIPANVISIDVAPMRYGSAVGIGFDLASTGPGAGHDSVGHSPGVYRNRVVIEPIKANKGE